MEEVKFYVANSNRRPGSSVVEASIIIALISASEY
jgi:hypothetical protein